MKKLGVAIRHMDAWKLILSATVVAVFFSIMFHGLIDLFGIPDVVFGTEPNIENYGIAMMVFAGIIFAPLLETALNQSLPYLLLKKLRYFRKHRFWIVLIAGIIFGLMHTYTLHYMVYTTFVGMFLMYLYIVRWNKNAFWIVAAIHAAFNATSTIAELLLGTSTLK